MRNLILLVIFIASVFSVNAQKRANIDNYRVKIQTVKLPKNYTKPEKRTYTTVGTTTKGLKLYGWEYTDDANATVVVKVQNQGVTAGGGKLDTKKTETKDKDGKVTKTTTTYRVSTKNNAKGIVRLYGPKNEMPTARQAAKEEKKGKKKKPEKKEVKEDNPFLANVDTEAPKEELEEDVEVNREQSYMNYIKNEYSYDTGYKKSSSAAWNTFRSNQYSQLASHRSSWRKNAKSQGQSFANMKYGYAPVTTNVKFKTLKSKKHAEYKTYLQAMEGLKAIFAKSKYFTPNDQIKQDIAPIVDYLIGLTEKYTEDNKQIKKVRSSAFYNLMQLSYYLDDFENAKKYANSLIAMKANERDAKKIIKNCDETARQLAFHNMTQRHLDLQQSESDEGEEEVVEEEEDEEAGGGK